MASYSSVYPAAPWRLQGQLWVSLFRVTRSGGRSDGLYGAAFVSYEPSSDLTYSELLVARPVGGGRVEITDIWVDSPASREGGRSLWAIPKELADLPLRAGDWGPVVRTSFGGVAEGRHLASATFMTTPRAAVLRLPFATATSQPALDGEAGTVVSHFSGSARAVPSRAVWRFDEEGPLAFLRGRRPLASFHLRDVALRFG